MPVYQRACLALLVSSIALLVTGCLPPPPLSYQEIHDQAMANEHRYANGYESIGFNPDIMTIPGRPFTATRIYSEWPLTAGPNDPPADTVSFTVARDGQGRIHYESKRYPKESTDVMLYDPIRHITTRYFMPAVRRPHQLKPATQCTQPSMNAISLDAPGKPAFLPALYQLPAPGPKAKPTTVTEELGNRMIMGLLAYGVHRTWQTTGRYQNTIDVEEWFSGDYGLNLLKNETNSGQNRSSIATVDIQFAEPDPSLFQLPPDFQVSGKIESCNKP